MVISSSNVQMDSNRSFKAKQSSGSSIVIGSGQAGGSTNQIMENTVSYRTKESFRFRNFTEMLKDDMVDDATAEMESSMLGMKSGSAALSRLNGEEQARSFQRIQEATIMYLLRNLRQLFSQNMQHGRGGFRDTLRSYSEREDFARDGWGHDRDISAVQETGMIWQSGFISRSYAAANAVFQMDLGAEALSGNVIASTAQYSDYYEEENTSFSTMGKVVTADGREIDFGIEIEMSRSFEEYLMKQTDIAAFSTPNLVDPLVINLNGSIADVSDQKFLFDLDSDGEQEEISMLNYGSGFLALDKNGDGIINDGSELFGTKSGDGFADLEKYDLDGNGWIDENDEIFDLLKIWTKDANGKDVLYTLKETGVGAICLQRAATQFSENNLADNTTNAIIRQTGIFLYENGGVGTVQHLDLAT